MVLPQGLKKIIFENNSNFAVKFDVFNSNNNIKEYVLHFILMNRDQDNLDLLSVNFGEINTNNISSDIITQINDSNRKFRNFIYGVPQSDWNKHWQGQVKDIWI